MTEKINWHHLFGWTLTDYFTGSNYKVEIEKDLSTKPQLLDVLIIEKTDGKPLATLPDGLDNLSAHNLVTYKSLQEPLDTLTLLELSGHYINYRKWLDFKGWKELPADSFRLYAVSTRYPRKLLKQEFNSTFKECHQGVYEVVWGSHTIRILALNQMSKQAQNAIWQFFSGTYDGFKFGDSHYQWRNPNAKMLLNTLYQLYLEEGIVMSYTFEEAIQHHTTAFLNSLTPEERLRGLPAAQVVKQFSPKEVFEQFSPKEVFEQFSPQDVVKQFSPKEVFEQFSPKEILTGLPPDVMAELLATLSRNKKD